MTDPLALFDQWYAEVKATPEVEPQSMVISTVDAQNKPHSRVVFLRRIVDGVYYFFTNYNSGKGQSLTERPYASLNFHWRAPEHRQVRIEGSVIKASKEISDEYFNGRPRGSQIGAWSSPQSQKIENRKELEDKIKMFEEKFAGKEIPRPEFWGGFGIIPERMEFWQAGDSRLHHRRLFVKKNNQWEESLLAP